ncbi:MAG TPA: carbohydrate porin [Gemmatales bacterium]|nr:carbohydrate porin [Gemmatales bacterium]
MFKLSLATAGVSAALLCIVSPASAQNLAPSTTIIWNAPDDKAKPAAPATAAPAPVVESAACASCATGNPGIDFSNKATGNWGGSRDDLAAKGITFDANLTQFYQGVNSGGRDENYFYGGHLDYYLNVDGEKAGLMKGSFIQLHAEQIYGQSANRASGALIPVSMTQVFPNADGNDIALTGIKYTQFLSENFAVFGGKLNTIDSWTQQYAAGRGIDTFMNMNFCFPMTYARTIPYSTWGAGFAVLKDKEVVFTFAAMDTANTPTSTGFENFFQNGVTMMAMGTLPVEFNGLKGHQSIGGSYSTGSYFSIDRNSYFNPIDGTIIAGGAKVAGSWSLCYSFDQALFADGCDCKRTWGIFGNLGVCDANPSPIGWAGTIGIGGASPISSRHTDNFGVGYFYTNINNDLKDFAPRRFPLRDEQGLELFYNVAVTPWCHITPDFQYVLPGREQFDTAFLFGLRMKIDF